MSSLHIQLTLEQHGFELSRSIYTIYMGILFNKYTKGFPGGAVVRNPPANARDMDLSPGPGRSHMLWST